MQQLCRACLEQNGENEGKSVELFGAFFRGEAIGTLLHELFSIEISQDDNLPQSICRRCFLELQTVFVFKDKLLKTDATLRTACINEALSNDEDHLLEETVVSFSATATSSELIDHEYTTIEVISSRCGVCDNVIYDSVEHTFFQHKADHDEDVDVSGNLSTKRICHPCYERLQREEGKDNDGKLLCTEEKIVNPPSADVELRQRESNQDQQSKEPKSQRFCCVTHCNEMFGQESDLLKHAQDTHSLKVRLNREKQEPGKPYKCNVCQRAFKSQKNLRMHQFVRTNQHSKQYACQECPFRAVSNALLIIHERSHTGERPFGCNLCPKRFYSELNLKNHQICHQTEREFVCSYCSKQFARKRNMEEHVRSCHSNEKPYHCDMCSAQFKVQQHLRLHRRLHTGEKPYSCSYCPSSFYHISDRKRHELSHAGEKPYSCKSCGLSYTRKRTLTIHERTHTGERPFSCNDCGKTFNQSSLLKRHMARHRNSECSDLVAQDGLYGVEVNQDRQEPLGLGETFVIEGVYRMDHA
uniref:Uncharacterized protein n=1 Tax=Anopheles atroparvus TaxID=41427 RepID=A0AAG5CXN7_ANOAO